MNPIQAPVTEDQNVVEFAESPGRRLRIQRQSKGLEIIRVATQLHLRPSLIEALERDQYDALPGPVFVTGYLRNYARLLGMDAEPILAAYRAANPGLEETAPRLTPVPRSEIGSGHIVVRLITLALIAGVIAMLVLWWQNRAEVLSIPSSGDQVPGLALDEEATASSEHSGGDPSLEPSASLTAPGPVSADLPSQPATPPTDVTPDGSAAQPEVEPGTAVASDAATLPPPAVQSAEPAAPAESAGLGAAPEPAGSTPDGEAAVGQSGQTQPPSPEVALAFSGPCWIDVRDATGAVVLNGEMRKGDRRVLEGQAPYSFVIGNARSTSISVGGKPLDLGSRSKGNVARFKLDPDTVE